MPYFAPIPEREYVCEGCKRTYVVPAGGQKIGCAVHHLPGTCCHYGEREVTNSDGALLPNLLDEES